TPARRSSQGAGPAAVSAPASPAAPAGTGRHEKRPEGRNLFGPAESPEREFPPDEFAHPFRVLLHASIPRSPRKTDGTRRHAVDADVVAGQLLRHRLGDADFGGFHGVVGHP